MTAAIRRARQADFDQLVAVSTRTIRACYTGFLGEDAVEGWLGSGAVDDYFRSCLADCTVLETESVLAGFSVAKGALIDLMMIDWRRHRQGMGSLLLDHVETDLFKAHPELRLESFADNGPANAFYESRGWRPGSRFEDKEAGVAKIEFSKQRA